MPILYQWRLILIINKMDLITRRKQQPHLHLHPTKTPQPKPHVHFLIPLKPPTKKTKLRYNSPPKNKTKKQYKKQY